MRAIAIRFALLALVILVAVVRYAPPEAAPLDAPRERCSAGLAGGVQTRLVDVGHPTPDAATRSMGSEGSRRASELLVGELEKLGFVVETQRAMSCTHYGMCATVNNVMG